MKVRVGAPIFPNRVKETADDKEVVKDGEADEKSIEDGRHFLGAQHGNGQTVAYNAM